MSGRSPSSISDDDHYYQPGYLFIPFGVYTPDEVVKPTKRFIPEGVDLVHGEIDRVDAEANQVHPHRRHDRSTTTSWSSPPARRRVRTETPGMDEGEWRKSIHDFYTLEGATALGEKLATWEGGRSSSTSWRCPSSARWRRSSSPSWPTAFFREHGIRDQVEIIYVTPLSGRVHQTDRLRSTSVACSTSARSRSKSDFMVEHIDPDAKKLVSYDEREVPFDLLVTIPLNMGADFVARSGLGDELNYVQVDKQLSCRRSTTTSSRSATPRTSRPPRPVRWRTSRSTSSPHNFLRYIDGLADD